MTLVADDAIVGLNVEPVVIICMRRRGYERDSQAYKFMEERPDAPEQVSGGKVSWWESR